MSAALSSPADIAGATYRFVPLPPRIHAQRILRIQGYTDLQRVRPAIRLASESMAALAATLSVPRVAYRRVPIRAMDGGGLQLEGNSEFHCLAFDPILRGCSEVAVFVLTVGPKLDARVMEFAERGELLEALLLETSGWLCIEDATRQFKVHLREQAIAEGRRITSRMGPGYSYKVDGAMASWPLEEQSTLFGLFGGADLPVALMRSSAMQPKMSRSGLFGIGPAHGPR